MARASERIAALESAYADLRRDVENAIEQCNANFAHMQKCDREIVKLLETQMQSVAERFVAQATQANAILELAKKNTITNQALVTFLMCSGMMSERQFDIARNVAIHAIDQVTARPVAEEDE